ncbi:MAG: DUF58 domain-containing protein [Desulfobacteraceae bacterium]|nr:DUF58 domain-containing protein [Desulfobacteraceae bacterium]
MDELLKMPGIPLPASFRFGSRNRARRIYVFPTRYGAIFLVVLLTMLMGSANYGNNMGFLLTFLLGSLVLVSAVHTHHNLAGVRVDGVRCAPVFAGQPALFECRLRASRCAEAVHLAVSSGRARDLRVCPDNSASASLPVPTRHRGRKPLETVVLSSVYPFGLFRAWTHYRSDAACLVYPKPLPGPLVTAGDARDPGAGGKPSGTGAEDFTGMRGYQPGDSLHRVSWKAFSRGRGLMVKQFAGEEGISPLFDWYALPEPDVETKLSRLCDMVQQGHRSRMKYGLRLPSGIVEPGRGERHRRRCLETLALYGLDSASAQPKNAGRQSAGEFSGRK